MRSYVVSAHPLPENSVVTEVIMVIKAPSVDKAREIFKSRMDRLGYDYFHANCEPFAGKGKE